MGTPFGFPDWQNQRPLDGPLLLDINALSSLQANQLGTVYVGRWARIGGDAFISNQPALWTFSWYADQAATKLLARRTFVTHNSISEPLRFMLPNLGPWVRVAYSCPNALPTPILTHHLYGTNREPSMEAFSGSPVLASFEAATILNNASLTTWLNGYHSGRAKLWANVTQVFAINVWAFKDATTMYRVYNENNIAAATDRNVDLVLPPTACQVVLNNSAGVNATAYLGVWPDTAAG